MGATTGIVRTTYQRLPEYGDEVVKRVAARLSAQLGKGFSLASLKRMKQFYWAFPAARR